MNNYFLFYTRALWRLGLICLLFIGGFCPIHIAAQTYEGRNLVHTQLLVSSDQWSKPFYLAVYFKIAPEWHLYWKNAGDSGIPPTLSVQLPVGYSAAGEWFFPTPHYLNTEGSINYVYSDELLLLLPIKPTMEADTATAFTATIYADWLVCREKCLRGTDTLYFDSRQLNSEVLLAMQKRISTNLISLPKPLSDLGIKIKSTRFKGKKDKAQVQLLLSAEPPAGTLDFFPESISGYTIAYDKIAIKKRRKIIIPLMPEGNATPPPQAIRGLLLLRNMGYSVD
jgi:DsbC/DsbD-like thiol-disulfide interchange protein